MDPRLQRLEPVRKSDHFLLSTRSIEEARVQVKALGFHITDHHRGRTIHELFQLARIQPVQRPIGQAGQLRVVAKRLGETLSVEVEITVLCFHRERCFDKHRADMEDPISEVQHMGAGVGIHSRLCSSIENPSIP